jgi:septal ring factor EnvC (AmiA/AmiB activator)
VVIIDHGAGWATTVTGLGAARARAGATVAAGAPIGTAADGNEIGVELRRRGRPVDIAALL